MSKKPIYNTNLCAQVFEEGWFLDTGENWVACVAGQEEHYNLLLVSGCHQ